MMITTNFSRNITFTIVFVLSSCGGGSGGSPFADQGDGIDRSGLTTGAITGFGSVIVNDIKYESATAQITVNGANVAESSLRVGQIVTVKGTFDNAAATGTAQEITADPNLVGPIAVIDLANSAIEVLGQIVIIDNDSVLVPSSLVDFLVGDVVEVYGFFDANENLVATRVEVTTDTEFELTGRIQNLDTQALSFQVVNQQVDYSAAQLADFGSEAIMDGQLVEVEGTSFNANGVFILEKVSLLAETFFDAEDEGLESQIEGIVTRFSSATDFDIGPVRITTNSTTVYEGGEVTDIALDKRLEVEGEVDQQGVLVAEEVEFESESNAEMRAVVSEVDLSAQTLTLFAQVIATHSATQFIDEGPDELQQFSLDDVLPGDTIKLKLEAASALIASLVKRVSPENEAKLEGAIESINSPSFVVLGVTVTDVSGSNGFVDQFTVGDKVEVSGTDNGDGTMTIDLSGN